MTRSSLAPRIEPLEPRIAPADLLNARTLVFTDADGDMVKLIFSRDVFTGDDAARLALANQVFTFDTGTVAHDSSTAQQLELIDFTKIPLVGAANAAVNHLGLTITATQQGGGDGLVDVGAISASGRSLANIVIDGDLGKITAGATGLKVGISALTVNSLGKRGTATQIQVPAPTPDNPAPDLFSKVVGEVTFLNVLEDVVQARFRVSSSGSTFGKIGSLVIGGSLIGRPDVESASDRTGLIECDRAIDSVNVGTAGEGSIIGGGGLSSGRINAGTIGSVTIKGDVIGGGGINSGTVTSSGFLTKVKITGDIVGGAGESSGMLRTFGTINSLTLQGSLIAGTGEASATINALGTITKVVVTGNLDGTTANSGTGSATIMGGTLSSVKLGGSLLGGVGPNSATISCDTLGSITVSGHLAGGDGSGSGSLVARATAGRLTIIGDITGGAGDESGILASGFDPQRPGDMDIVKIMGKVSGGDGDHSGSITAGGRLNSISIGTPHPAMGDALAGGAGLFSGAISAQGIGSATITGNLRGGRGNHSGAIFSFDRVDAAAESAGDIGIIQIAGQWTGGGGDHSGTVQADGDVNRITAAGLSGGLGTASGTLYTGVGLVEEGNVGAVRIFGGVSIAAVNPGANSANFIVGGQLRMLSIAGDTTGAAIHVGNDAKQLRFGGNVTDTVVTARGQEVQGKTSDVAVGTLKVSGSVMHSSFLAGYDLSTTPVNPDAQINIARITGDWTASDLVAGAAEGADPGFGNAFDVKAPGKDAAGIISKIARLTIGGSATGSGVMGDSFGFVAQLIVSAKIGSVVFPLNNLPDGQVFPVGDVSNEVTIREIGV